jgi:aminopeptidase N
MLNTFLGGDLFMNGVRSYLQAFKYRNTVTADLWHHLSQASGQDVASLMRSWTKEMGYPLVIVESEEFDEAKGQLTVKLSQSRFLSAGGLKAEEDKVIWWIPVSIVTHLSPENPSQHILSTKSDKLTFPYSKTAGAYWKMNLGTSGFFRVKYSDDQISSIGDMLFKNPTALPTADRVTFVADSFALSRSGQSSVVAALNVIKSLRNEESYI